MTRYLIVIEESATGYSAFSPDLPGCVATAEDRQKVEQAMREGIEFHLAGLRGEGQPIPKPSTSAAYVSVAA